MREYLIVFLVAAAVTYLVTVIAREIAIRTGAVARVRDRDVHAEPIPYLGGLAMLGGLFAGYTVARELPFLALSQSWVFDDALAVLVAGALICAVGVLDDIFELDALTKFGGQVLAVGVLVLMGVQYRWFFDPSGEVISLEQGQGALLTALVVLTTVNAVNFIDGLDGLAAGVIGLGAVTFFVYCYLLSVLNHADRATTGALLAASLAGACLGFLAHNFHPARLFMGDSGSMLIGLVLSSTAIVVTSQFHPDDLSHGAGRASVSWLPFILPALLPVLILVVPLSDLVLAVVRRTRAGRSPFSPDKQHLHHRLLEIGHSQRRAVLLMWLWAAMIGFGTVLASIFEGWFVWTGIAVALAVTIALTFAVPVIRKPGSGRSSTPPPPAAPAGGATPDATPPGTL